MLRMVRMEIIAETSLGGTTPERVAVHPNVEEFNLVVSDSKRTGSQLSSHTLPRYTRSRKSKALTTRPRRRCFPLVICGMRSFVASSTRGLRLRESPPRQRSPPLWYAQTRSISPITLSLNCVSEAPDTMKTRRRTCTTRSSPRALRGSKIARWSRSSASSSAVLHILAMSPMPRTYMPRSSSPLPSG